MIFANPIPFAQALRSRAVKAALPNSLTSDELSRVEAGIAERANMMAGASKVDFINKVDEVVTQVLLPASHGGGLSKAYARTKLKELLRSVGYQPEPGERGGMRDLSSDPRLNLILDTQVKMATGYGQWEVGQRRAILWQWPAWELVRKEARKEPRDWPARWEEDGGVFYPGPGAYGNGRMIARKDSTIWVAISRFGLPYPPFDFNSGMGLDPVDRATCEKFGIVRRDQAVAPQRRDFASDAQVVMQASREVTEAALKSLGDGYEVRDGVLRRAA